MSIHNMSRVPLYQLACVDTQPRIEEILKIIGASTDDIVASVAQLILAYEPFLRDCDFETLEQIKAKLIHTTHVNQSNPFIKIITQVSQRILDIKEDSMEILNTAILEACIKPYQKDLVVLKNVQKALEGGAEIAAKCEVHHSTALLYACQNGYTQTVNYLIENGASIHEKNRHSYTAIMYAAMKGHTEIVVMLKELGASINECIRGNTPLTLAAYNGHAETVFKLIELGAWGRNIDLFFTNAAIGLRKEIHRLAEVVVEKYPQSFVQNTDQFIAGGFNQNDISRLLKVIFINHPSAYPPISQFHHLLSPEEIRETFRNMDEANKIDHLGGITLGSLNLLAKSCSRELQQGKFNQETFDRLKKSYEFERVSIYTLAVIAEKFPQTAATLMPFYSDIERAVVIPLLSRKEWIRCFNGVSVPFHIDFLKLATKKQVEAYLKKDLAQLEYLQKWEGIKNLTAQKLKVDWLEHHQSMKFALEQFHQILKRLETLPQFNILDTYIKEKREYLARIETELSIKQIEIKALDTKEEISEEFLDPVTYEIMQNPYTLETIVPGQSKTVKTTLDYSTWLHFIENSHSINPYTQQYFKLEDLKPNVELQNRIQNENSGNSTDPDMPLLESGSDVE